MSTLNITLNNPSPEAIRELVRASREQNIEVTPLSVFANTYSFKGETVEEAEKRIGVQTHIIDTASVLHIPAKAAYIFDIDGVIADHKHRLHYIDGTDAKLCKCGHNEEQHHHSRTELNVGCLHQNGVPYKKFCPCKKFRPGFGRNWTGYFKHMAEDTPIVENIITLKALAQSFKIIFITGRPESAAGSTKDFRKITEDWIKQHVGITDYELWMRPRGNFKPNAQLKRQLVQDWISTKNVRGVFEDNPEAVKMYREQGLTVYQVGGGWDDLTQENS